MTDETENTIQPEYLYRYGEALPPTSDMLLKALGSDEVQQLFDSLRKLTVVPMSIIDLNANVLFSSPWQRICADFYRVHPKTCARCVDTDTRLTREQLDMTLSGGKSYCVYTCTNGLLHSVFPIVIEGTHVANLFTGQFLTEPPDEAFFRAQADEFGFDRDAFLAAAREAPVVPQAELDVALDILNRLAQVITRLCVDRDRADRTSETLGREIAEKEQVERELQLHRQHLEEQVESRTMALRQAMAQLRQSASVFEHASEGIFITDPEGAILDINDAFTLLTGFGRNDVLGRTPRMFKSDRHGPEFYAAMWRSLKETGRWDGEIWNRRKNGDVFPERLTITAVKDEQGRPQRYVALFSDITEQKAQEKRLEEVAHYDALTGLPNRWLLADRMGQALGRSKRTGETLVVCMMDLDGFKPVNDSLGHKAGDVLLREIARRLLNSIREVDTAARVGGDEFALLLGGFPSENACAAALRRLLAYIAQPFAFEGHPIQVTGSLGVTFYRGGDGVDADGLLRQADQAMYIAKEKGKNGYHIFDGVANLRQSTKWRLNQRIQDALDVGQFHLWYEPRIDCRDGRVDGLEVSPRWFHPTLGVRAPAEFLPLLEHDEAIARVGEWVVAGTLRQMEEWRKEGLDLPVSVNLDVKQLLHADYVERLAALFDPFPVELANRLEVELVETAALVDIGAVSDAIAALRGRGLRFSLDDFGTGYSSLAHLRRLSVDSLRIAPNFVHNMLDDPGDLAFVQGIIALASAFGHGVVATGVESTERILALSHLGCHLMQGSALAPSMSGECVPGWVRQFCPDPLWRVDSRQVPPRGYFDIMLMEVAFRHWLGKLLDENAATSDTSALETEEANFEKWRHGVEAGRRDGFSALSALQPLELRVRHLARSLLDAHRAGNADAVRVARQALGPASEELLGRMYRQRLAPSVPPACPIAHNM